MADSIFDFDPIAANNTSFAGTPYGPNQLYHNQIDNLFRAYAGALGGFVDDLGAVATPTGTATDIAVTLSQGFTAYGTAAGQIRHGTLIALKMPWAATGAATLNINSIGTKNIRRQGDAAIQADDWALSGVYFLRFDSAYDTASGAWVLMNPAAPSADLSALDAITVNQASIGGYGAKTQLGFTGYRRGKNVLWDGFADSSGINVSRSSNYSLDASAKALKPSTPAIALTYTAQAVDTGDLTTYTFASQALGTASADRKIVVGIVGAAGGARTISSVTVGGVSATALGTLYAPLAGVMVGFYIASVPTGTTGSVVVTWSSGCVRCAIGLWAVTGASSTVSATLQNGAEPQTGSLTVPANGAFAAIAYNGNNTTYTWTNATEDFDAAFELGEIYSGASGTSTPGGSITITATAAATGGSIHHMMAVALAPSASGVNNMTYSSTVQTADAAVTSVTAYFELDEIDAITLPTHLTGLGNRNAPIYFTSITAA